MISRSDDIGSGGALATRPPDVDFALVLSRVIELIKDDPAQLRNTVYELARTRLQKEAWQRNPPMSLFEMKLLMMALELAIERGEIVASKQDELRSLQSLERLAERSQIDAGDMLIEPRKPLRNIDEESLQTAVTDRSATIFAPARRAPFKLARPSRRSGAAPLLRGAIVVAIFSVGLCAALGHQFGWFGRQAPQPSSPVVQKIERAEAKSVVQAPGPVLQSTASKPQPQSPEFPLPSVYGVYAVSGGQLYELEALPIGRVPDQRIFMSTPIKAPSRTVLPDGRIVFIVYRRDVVNSAPERITVRAIAKIMQDMKFTSAGQVSRAKVEDTWTLRNVSYNFRVGPIGANYEMLLIRPENGDFEFPAGRYGLAFKDLAYDFTVAGRVTEAAQCLERVEAANGAFYSECRRP